MSKTKCLIWVYILDAQDLMSKDNGPGLDKASDPYLRIKLNGELIDEWKSYILN